MADANSHVNVPTRARRPGTRPYPEGASRPADDESLTTSAHVNVPTNERVEYDAQDANAEGGSPFVKLAGGAQDPATGELTGGGWPKDGMFEQT